MFNRSPDTLFQLIKSLTKSEKRSFKLFAKRNVSNEELKTIQLFDALDKMNEYNETTLLKKTTNITKTQLSNLKAQLYRQLLNSMRLLHDEKNISLQLNELMDHARILYNKGLYLQSLKTLDKLKEQAREYQQFSYVQQVIFFEKKIEALYITRSMRNRASHLAKESTEVLQKLTLVNNLSNLSLQLYSWYIEHGHARNKKELHDINIFFREQLPDGAGESRSFYEQLYLHQSYCWYAFIRLDFLQYYRHCQQWVDCYDTHPQMLSVEMGMYIKGMHNLMNAQFALRQPGKIAKSIRAFEQFARQKIVRQNQNTLILAYQYLYLARINYHFLTGTFSKGLHMVPYLEKMLIEFNLYLDAYRVLVFYYKIACLYFGSGDNGKAIHYLNLIINSKNNLRTDLQCYARLLHLIAHYELGNFQLLEYLTKSVYRFMAKMENLSQVEEAIFAFLRKSFKVDAHALQPEFEKLRTRLLKYEGNPLEARAFAYLDIISWLESKIKGLQVQDVIREKSGG